MFKFKNETISLYLFMAQNLVDNLGTLKFEYSDGGTCFSPGLDSLTANEVKVLSEIEQISVQLVKISG